MLTDEIRSLRDNELASAVQGEMARKAEVDMLTKQQDKQISRHEALTSELGDTKVPRQLSHRSSLASTTAVIAVPCRVVCITGGGWW